MRLRRGLVGVSVVGCMAFVSDACGQAPPTCPAPSAIIVGTACNFPEGTACGGTILDSCGHPATPVFQCSCAAGLWQCAGTEIDAGACNAGHD